MDNSELTELATQLGLDTTLSDGQKSLMLVEKAAEIYGLGTSRPFAGRIHPIDSERLARLAGFPKSLLLSCKMLYSKIREGNASKSLEADVRSGKSSPNSAYQASTKARRISGNGVKSRRRRSSSNASPVLQPVTQFKSNDRPIEALVKAGRESVICGSRAGRLGHIILSIGGTIARIEDAIPTSRKEPSLNFFLENARAALVQLHSETINFATNPPQESN